MLTTLSVLSLDQGKIYRASPPSQFDDRTVAEAYVNQVDPRLARNQCGDLQARSRPTTGFTHVLHWTLAMIALRGRWSGVQKGQKTTAGGNCASISSPTRGP